MRAGDIDQCHSVRDGDGNGTGMAVRTLMKLTRGRDQGRAAQHCACLGVGCP